MNLKKLKIETIYKDSKGNIIDKKDIPKIARVTTLIKDKDGFEYKTKKSKNSIIKKYSIKPIKEEKIFNYSEDSICIKIQNDKFSLIYNKKNNMAEINSILSPIYSKGYTASTLFLRQIFIPLEDVQSVKEDNSLFNVLVEL